AALEKPPRRIVGQTGIDQRRWPVAGQLEEALDRRSMHLLARSQRARTPIEARLREWNHPTWIGERAGVGALAGSARDGFERLQQRRQTSVLRRGGVGKV